MIRSRVKKYAIVWFLTTLLVLFSFEGQTNLTNPLLVTYLAVPT
jgi:ACR3 family arsenite efflux pump ArsB